MIPNTKAPVAKTLRDNGYSTAQFGKCHEVPVWETSPMGPFDHWPTMQGFEKFYGFIGGETNQWYPEVFDNLTRVECRDPKYHFTEDMADKTIDWIKAQKAIYPTSPSSSTGRPAPRTPRIMSPPSGSRSTRASSMTAGTNRERTFARQKELGVIPADAELTRTRRDSGLGRHAGRALADPTPPDGGLRRVLEHTDHEVGRWSTCSSRPRSSTTPLSTTSSVTTAPRPKGRSTAPSTR